MIAGTLSVADHLAAQRLHRAVRARRVYLVCVIAIVLGPALFWLGGRNIGFTGVIGLLAFGGGLGGIIGESITARFMLPRRVRRIHAQQREFASPITYRWDAECLEGQSASGQSKRPWVHYVKVKEDDVVFVLYRADNLLEAFPKRWFQDEAQIDEFRQLASQAGAR